MAASRPKRSWLAAPGMTAMCWGAVVIGISSDFRCVPKGDLWQVNRKFQYVRPPFCLRTLLSTESGYSFHVVNIRPLGAASRGDQRVSDFHRLPCTDHCIHPIAISVLSHEFHHVLSIYNHSAVPYLTTFAVSLSLPGGEMGRVPSLHFV